VYSKTRETIIAGQRVSFLEIFRPNLLHITTLTSLMAIGAQGGYYAVTSWLPTFLKTQRHLSVLNTGGYLAVVIAGSLAGYLVSAHLADWLGREATLILFALGSFATVAGTHTYPLAIM
jgi:sugar phosphate permease